MRKTGYSHDPRVSDDDSGKEAGRPYSDEWNEEKDKDIDDEESEEIFNCGLDPSKNPSDGGSDTARTNNVPECLNKPDAIRMVRFPVSNNRRRRHTE